MRPYTVVAVLGLLACACAAPPPVPVAAPSTPPPPPAVSPGPAEERVSGTVTVAASSLNVRKEPSTGADVVAQVRRGAVLGVVRVEGGWVRVRLADGTGGWVAERFVERAGGAKKRGGRCPADSDFAFEEAPPLSFSDHGAHGLVVVDATVNANGVVTGTKVVSNSTGDDALASLAEKEIRSARFSPPIRDCMPRAFVFTYRRTF